MMKKHRTMEEITDSVPMCGCGSDLKWTVVKEMLERAALKPGDEARKSFYDGTEDASARWVEFVAGVLSSYSVDLLEHGTSIGWAWLTPDGERLLSWLRQYGCDTEKWPKEAEDGSGDERQPDWNEKRP